MTRTNAHAARNRSERRSALRRATKGRATLAFVVAMSWWLALSPAVTAQTPPPNVQHTENKADLALKGGASVDPSTLAMGLSIPLDSYPGRAGADLPVAVNYSSKVWRLDFFAIDSTPNVANNQSWTQARFAEHTTAGWTSTLAPPRIEFTGFTQYFDSDGRGGCLGCDPESDTGEYYVKRIHAHLPDGSSHELRQNDQTYNTYPQEPFTGTFLAVDGSRMRYESNAGGTSTLHLPDGSRYLFPAYNLGNELTATQYLDRHGNALAYDAANRQWTDTLGRVIPNPLPASPAAGTTTQFGAKLVGGGEAAYTFRWERLADVLTPDQDNNTPELRFTGDEQCRYNSYAYTDVTPALFTSFSDTIVCAEEEDLTPVRFNPVVLAEVGLPTGNKYVFTYTVYGEIDRVSLPTGGSESFVYDGVPTLSHSVAPYDQPNRGVIRHGVSASEGVAESAWTYEATGAPGQPYEVKATAPDGTYSLRLLHRGLDTGLPGSSAMFGFEDVRAGMAFDERAYSAADVMLRRTLTEWVMTGEPGGSAPAPTRDPKVTKQVSILLDTNGPNALWSASVSSYDQASQPLNLTSTTQYGYDSSMSKATAETAPVGSFAPSDSLALRTTETTYVDDDDYFDRGLVSLPTSVTVRAGMPASGAVASFTQMSYDEQDYAPLPCEATVGRGDAGAGPRGDATTVSRWLDMTPDDVYLKTHARYDGCGSVRQSWDARGKLSQVFYSADTHFAYPTRSLTPVPDPDGSNGAGAELETRVAYDFDTGRVVSATDFSNGRTTSYSFSDDQGVKDPLNRLCKVTRPDGGWTKYDYGNAPGDLFIRTRTALDAARHTDSYQYFDGLGRPSRAFAYDGSALERAWVASDTEYDEMLRVRRVSNPYFVSTLGGTIPAESVRWTTTEYDDLGRARSVTTPDGAQAVTAYVGNEVTVTDQDQKKRGSVKDALGRLTKAVEAAGVTGYGYETNYEYDALDNLTKVIQGTPAGTQQTRLFTYDTLSRLTSAQNPESGTARYEYDENSNLKVKLDARHVRTDYDYDNLNRSVRRSYSIESGHPTPPAFTTTPEVEYFYDGTGLTDVDGVALPAPADSKGRLTKVKSAVSETVHTAFDAMGRMTASAQTTGGVTYPMPDYRYDLAGNLVSQQYPSGKVVKTEFDAAGRLAGVKNDTTGLYYAGGVASEDTDNRVQYAAHGAASAMRLGNGLWEHTKFNSRLQPTEIGLGISVEDSGKLRLDYGYGASNNGNVHSQRILIAGSLDLTQTYDYDAVNRLSWAREAMTADDTQTWKQTFTYLDSGGQNGQFGNRRVDAANSTLNVTPQSNPQIDPVTNRYGDGQGYSYDDAGNLTAEPGGRTYSYDAENRLTAVNGGLASGVGAEYAYDGDGRRVRKATSSEVTVFVYDVLGRIVAEYGNQAGVAGTSYLTPDHLGSTRVVTDQSQGLVSRHDYLPFGEEAGAGVGGRTPQQGYVADNVRQKFTGYERDGETGLDYAQARYYASAQGRFISTDPLYFQVSMAGDPQRFNLYAYTRNNPLKFIDPDGERLHLRGATGWLTQNVLYGMVGGREEFNKYFNVAGGEVFLLPGIDLSGASAGVQQLAALVQAPQNFLFYAGTDGDAAAALFNGDRKNLAQEFTGTVPGRMDQQGGYLVGTVGRSSRARQPDRLDGDPNGPDVFSVVAWNTNAEMKQMSEDFNSTGAPWSPDAMRAAAGAAIVGVGQTIRPVNFFIHESAENLYFAEFGTRNRPFGVSVGKNSPWVDNYRNAHNFARIREATIMRDLRMTGGFAGGQPRTRVPKR